jgi:nitroreductase
VTTTNPFDLSQTDKLLTTTRSVRKRLDLGRPVPREVVLEALDVALQAPSGGNRQPWRWLILDDPDKKRAIAELYQRSHDPYMAMNREAVAKAGTGDKMNKIMDSSQYLSDHMAEVPVMVIPCLLARPEGLSQAEVAGFYGSILPAAWSFMLALRSRGLGSAWTTLHLAFEKEAQEILGVPETVTQTALIPVAYYTGDDFKPAPRQPADKVTYFNGWQQR